MDLAHFIRIGFGGSTAPDVFIEGYSASADFGTDTPIEEQNFLVVQTLG
jgi:hypothetical protein